MNKTTLIIAGVVAYIWWRQQSINATLPGMAGSATAVSTPASARIPSAGNSTATLPTAYGGPVAPAAGTVAR